MSRRASEAAIERIDVSAYKIPTDAPEADGTYAWTSTTLVVVEAAAGDTRGLGYTYADTATAHLIKDMLAGVVQGRNAMDVPGCWQAMVHAIRNLGRPGIASMAISAVDVALWDLKARLLDVALVTLLGAVRDAVPVYGSGGFTSYSIDRLQAQLGGWVEQGISRVKMKIGAHPADDLGRVRAARTAIGPDAALYVDANGAYSRKQALAQAELEFGQLRPRSRATRTGDQPMHRGLFAGQQRRGMSEKSRVPIRSGARQRWRRRRWAPACGTRPHP